MLLYLLCLPVLLELVLRKACPAALQGGLSWARDTLVGSPLRFGAGREVVLLVIRKAHKGQAGKVVYLGTKSMVGVKGNGGSGVAAVAGPCLRTAMA